MSVHGDILYFSSAHRTWISPNLDFRFAKDKSMIVFTIIIIRNYYTLSIHGDDNQVKNNCILKFIYLWFISIYFLLEKG